MSKNIININSSREAIKAIALKLESLGVKGETITNPQSENKRDADEVKMLIKLQETQQKKLLDSQIKELEQKQFGELMTELEKINKENEVFTNLKKQDEQTINQEAVPINKAINQEATPINKGLFDMVNIISETVSNLQKQGVAFDIKTENLDNPLERSSLLISINDNQNLPNKNQANQQTR